jgi:hypothetical protein
MKKVKSITCTVILLLLVSATASAKSGQIPTTKSGQIPTTKSGQIPTTRLGSIPTTRTNLTFGAESIQRASTRPSGVFLAELFWAVFGW